MLRHKAANTIHTDLSQLYITLNKNPKKDFTSPLFPFTEVTLFHRLITIGLYKQT